MNYFEGKTSLKVLTLYMSKNGVYKFNDVSNLKVVKASGDEDFTVNGRYLSFDYVDQSTGRKNHGIFDIFVLFGMSYEADEALGITQIIKPDFYKSTRRKSEETKSNEER